LLVAGMLADLKKLAGAFPAQPLTRGREMRDMLEQSPADFCAAAVDILGGEDSERVKRYLVALLWTHNLLLPCLLNPSIPANRAEVIALLVRKVDPQLPAKLVGFVLERTEMEPPECLERVLRLLKSMPDAASFRPLLTPLLRHPNARIRSKVALLAGEGNRNRTWFERRMLEDDPRVRANAIESAGAVMSEDLRSLFQTATLDSNNRVVGNALIALYRLGDADAVASLHELISRPDPAFRATAVWAMGETGDTRFLPVLAKILSDSNEPARSAAFRAIRKLRGRESKNPAPLAVRILGEPASSERGLKVVFDVTDQGRMIGGIQATAVRVLVNGEVVRRYSVVEQESRCRISVAFLMPHIKGLPEEQKGIYLSALLRCFEQRRPGDGWLASQYSGVSKAGGGSRPKTLFGVRVDSAEVCGIRPIGRAVDIRAVLESGDSDRISDFNTAFLGVCEQLRPLHVSSHLFLLQPVAAPAVDPPVLRRAAQEAHVTVHTICASGEEGFRDISRSTGGFYLVADDVAGILPAFYRGISHRYEATMHTVADVRCVQVAVQSAGSYGESQLVEIGSPGSTGI
jgi:hypothetical protein